MCNQYTLNIDGDQVFSEISIKLLGIKIDNKLLFDEHLSSLCKKTRNQRNAISRLHRYLGFKVKDILINSFIYADFNYCPFLWYFCLAESVRRFEHIQTRTLFDKSGKCTMEVKHLKTLGLEVFKTLNNLNPAFVEEIFHRT